MADCARKRGNVRFQGKISIVPDGESVLGRAADELVAREGISAHFADINLDITKENIRVNVVCPAVIRTPFSAVDVLEEKETADYVAPPHPMGRVGGPEEVAKAVAFLACEDASFITGVALPVDGGWIAR